MSYVSNISVVIQARAEQLKAIAGDKIARAAALSVLPEMRKRVHIEGKASDGSQIGTYSNAYLKVRTGSFQNADKFKKGKNVGKNKNAGTFTKGSGIGAIRPKYNRSADPKVILSLTRQMENDLSVVPAGVDAVGIGFKNPDNYNKAIWNQTRYKKKIWDLTQQEKEIALKAATTEFNDQTKQ